MMFSALLQSVSVICLALLTSTVLARSTKSFSSSPSSSNQGNAGGKGFTFTTPRVSEVFKTGQVTYQGYIPDCSTGQPVYSIPVLFTGSYSYNYLLTTYVSGYPQLNRTDFFMTMNGYTQNTPRPSRYYGTEALDEQFRYDNLPGQQYYTETFRTFTYIWNQKGIKDSFYADIKLRYDNGTLTPLIEDVRYYQCPNTQPKAPDGLAPSG